MKQQIYKSIQYTKKLPDSIFIRCLDILKNNLIYYQIKMNERNNAWLTTCH